MEPVTDCQSVTWGTQGSAIPQTTRPKSAYAGLWDHLVAESRVSSLDFWALWMVIPKDTRRAMMDELEPVKG